ncbi:MAG: hypothetical protein WC209_00600 [Ignavibacteriaceae bacterium]|jgi:hypothetical protein
MKKIITILSLIFLQTIFAQETDSLVTNQNPVETTTENTQPTIDTIAQSPVQQPAPAPRYAELKITDPKELRLEKIYRNLEYNTTAFNDLKKTWVVTDPVYVRELFNRFIVKNALTIEGIKPSLETLKAKARDIFDGNVFVELRKRYYDDEIEILRFFTESKLASQDSTDFFFDEIRDYVFIKNVLGEEMYQDLKKQFYALNDLTKTPYDNKYSYNYDIYLHFFNPELMFWSATTNQKNKYLVAAIGRWGNDFINIPGWYYPDYVAGVKVTYIDYLINNRPNNTYILEMGTGLPARQPVLGIESEEISKRLFHTGTNLYFKAVGNPIKLFWDDMIELEFTLQGMLSLTQYKTKDFKINYLTQFYSQRNHFTFMVRKKELVNFSEVGALGVGLGLSSYDIYHFLLDPDQIKLTDLETNNKGKFKNNILAEAFISGEGGLLAHNLSTLFSYDYTESYGYLGFKMFFMLNNTIGFDFRYFTSYRFSTKPLPFYRTTSYLVFSPVIRINY